MKMHFSWPIAVIGTVFLAGGVAMIVGRKPYATMIARRRQRLYPSSARRVLGFQESPTYYLVVGSVFTVIGLFFALGAIGSVIPPR
jgi:hypothetical protein